MLVAANTVRESSPQGLAKHLVHPNFHRIDVIVGH